MKPLYPGLPPSRLARAASITASTSAVALPATASSSSLSVRSPGFFLGLTTGQPALVWTCRSHLLNLFGIWRWLGRQAKVEDGSIKAARASEKRRENPVPGLAADPRQSPLRSFGAWTLRRRHGRVRERPVAYVDGLARRHRRRCETLRRLPWSELRAEGEEMVSQCDPTRFNAIEPVPKDQWPER